jgi:hypothetical protein
MKFFQAPGEALAGLRRDYQALQNMKLHNFPPFFLGLAIKTHSKKPNQKTKKKTQKTTIF